jgi:predicted ATPase
MLRRALEELVKAELIFGQGPAPPAQYVFKHALVQDAAYRSLLRSRRRQLHAQLARVLEQRFIEVVDTQPELLAHHFTQAGMIEEAVQARQRAGERAIARSAGIEATAHLTQALALLDGLPEKLDRHRHELDLQIALSSVIAITKGYGSNEADRVSRRARELCDLLGDTEKLPQVLLAQSAVRTIRGRYDHARDIGEEILELGKLQDDAATEIIGHQVVGVASFYRGEFGRARSHFEAILDLLEQEGRSTFGLFADARAVSLSHLSLILFICGHPEQARVCSHEALSRARDLTHPGSIADARSYRFIFSQLSGDLDAALNEAEAYVSISREQGFTMLLGEALMFHGWALAQTDPAADGIRRLREGVARWLTTRAKIGVTYNRALLADAYGRGGWPRAEQHRQLDKAIREAERYHEHWYTAELLRRRGLLLASDPGADPAASKADIRQAITLAHAQDARMWELRAVCSLHRLASTPRERAETRDLLKPLYASFTEGFETADLQEARTLLNR